MHVCKTVPTEAVRHVEHNPDSRNVIGTCNTVHKTYDLDLKLKDP